MNEKCISSSHIQKLGHEIQEIRERALLNIILKLDHGFKFDNELARSKEILTKLFDWFLFEPCTKQETVFSLIKQILQSESGKILINHYGTNTLKKDLKQIRTYLEPKYYRHLEEILQILDKYNVIVPPLETDVPLSYRTGQSEFSTRPVGSTATTIEGFIQQDSSANQRNTPQIKTASSDSLQFNYLIHPLKWQFLIEADRHVLQSIEDSLKNPPQPASLLHSADFFSSILLHDFPAEIFLQRPNIVVSFHDLITNCSSTRVVNSVLNCLNNLTKALRVRVNCYNDPCLYTTKECGHSDPNSRSTTPDSNSRKTASGQSDDICGRYENIDYLKTQQMSFPHYCFSTFKIVFKYLCVKPETLKSTRKKSNQKGTNLALRLLDELLNLLSMLFTQNIWQETTSPLVHEIRKQINNVLISYGASLDYFRIESISDDLNLTNRVTQLCFLHNCANFLLKMIPLSQTGLILPRNLKNALANCLVDVTLSKLYPNLYNTFLNYVQSFKVGLDGDALVKYNETSKICESMSCAVELMKTGKTLKVYEGIELASKALSSLEFHKSMSFIKTVVELCATKLSLYPTDDELFEKCEFVILKLLGHNVEQVQEETYKLCQKRIIAAIGPKLNSSCSGVPGAQILFLCRSKILVEIACHGMINENPQIRNYSEDILIHIIKCKILVSEDIWNKIVEALIGALPILLCHTNKNTSLGRNLLNIIDPDTAQSLYLPKTEIVKANIHMLFGSDASIREEAFSRLCWLLATQTDSRELLPRLNNLYDKALPNVCRIQRIFDINKIRSSQHFYQPSSLQQVLDLLKSPNVEPVIRRSALTQTSVMLEDPLLHTTFIANNGLEIVLKVLKSALIETNYNDYPDSVIPAVSILKNICLFQPSARQTLSVNLEVLYNVLRSLFMFFTEDKLKHDAVTLLFLLVFNDFIKGSPSKANFSVPYLVNQKIQIPVACNTHWEISQYYETSLVEFLLSDKCCMSSLQIQWNSEIFGGLDVLLSWKEIQYTKTDISDILKLNNYDLLCLKASSMDYYVKKYLIDIQNGTLHDVVIDSLNKLTTYVQLATAVSKQDNFLDHPWETTFSRFLKVLPSSEEDAQLLSNILKFLKLLVPFYKSSDVSFWLPKLLKNPSNCILDLITVEQSTNDEFKTLSQDLLSLITICASQEQHFLDYYTYMETKVQNTDAESWRNVIEIISNSLKFNDNTHFYNLSYLDNLLSCLVHLTASLGWSDTKPGSPPKRIFFELIDSLCELIVVFHCGKGPSATISVMGLSITRNVILILNHLISEMQNFKMKNWERCFIDVEEEDWLKSFLVLWSSRDVLLRAGALQFFAGLSISPILAINIVNELKKENHGVWHLALSLLLDQDEANVVKENAAYVLANLMNHSVNHRNKSEIVTSLIPNTMRKGKDEISTIFDLLEDYLFFKNLVTILTHLHTVNVSDFDIKSATNLLESHPTYDDSSSSDSTTINFSIVTPSFVKSLTSLLLNLFSLDENRLSCKLQDFGLVKLFFKCICNPSMSINDTKKLSLYCEIMEMDFSICRLLSLVAQVNSTCLGTLLHTKDCLTVVVSLLNPNIYHINLPQLIYLRNKLWSEIFKFLSVLTTTENKMHINHRNEALCIITETVRDSGREAFIETICEATKNFKFTDLQNSALLSLTSLLGSESQQIWNKLPKLCNELETCSMQDLLDSVRISETNTMTEENSIAGAQICKILLNLYDLCNLKVSKHLMNKKSMITASLTSLLCVSQEAKNYAFQVGLPNLLVKQLKDFCMKLSLESVDCLRRVLEKKRICPVLKELNELIGLIMNFMVGDENVKIKFAVLGLSDFIHKLWVWFALQNPHLVDILKMLTTFTTDCLQACQSLPLTSSVAGSGPRKAPSKISLLNVIINLIDREMEQISKTHNLQVLELCFEILKNCCSVLECRILICKSTLLSSVSRLHPAITKRQKPWDLVESIWLEFLQTFTLYPEGQSNIAKINDVFDLLINLASNSKLPNRITALLVLRNVAFYQSNRSRLLTSDDFLNLLKNKLENGNHDEKFTTVLIMWSLAANNQKAKIIFKSAKLDIMLQLVIKHYQLSSELAPNDDIETIRYVLNVIRES